MKLREVILKNFRGYYDETRISINDLTALIGKNDVGKSTILEALEIFFNQAKIESGDKNVFHTAEDTIIGCVFDDLPSEIALENVSTSFTAEYLLNEDGDLEIRKIYRTGGKQTIWINAKHPSNAGFDDLLSKKNQELKAMIRENGLENSVNLTINTEMRTALWESLGESITYQKKLISADQADEKKLWPKIEPLLPQYHLFKADRSGNADEDKVAQDPMQDAVRMALEEQKKQLADIAGEVQRKVSDVASRTISKLKEFDSELAKTLTPEFKKEPMWEKAFAFSLTGDNEIPLNKRGSGIRRLVLFSFFRASVESPLFEGKSIIYAIEEPETSQHPDAQRMILKTFQEMTEKNGCQIILTTHVPGLAGLLPVQSLRYITSGDRNPKVAEGAENESILRNIADTLGVLPYAAVKTVVYVEGPNDVAFISNLNQNIPELKAIIDLQEEHIPLIPLHGGLLVDWVNKDYFTKTNLREIFITDSDVPKYVDLISEINKFSDGRRFGWTTRRREMENYVPYELIEQELKVSLDGYKANWDQCDVPKVLIVLCMQNVTNAAEREKSIKSWLNGSLSKKITKEDLEDIDAWDEIELWFKKIRDIDNGTYVQKINS